MFNWGTFYIQILNRNLKNNSSAIKFLFANSDVVRNFIMENKKNIVRKDSNAPVVNIKDDLKLDEFIEYDSGDKKYYIGKNSNGNIYQIYSLEEKVKEIESINDEGEIKVDAITNLLGDWWDNFYKDMSRVDIEGNVKMKTSKKPERLIYRILELLTRPGDLVLDSFLGSGTTTAVAHKMGRKWIGIEMGEHCYTLSKKRMDYVIDGDQTGISKLTNWKGGGGYRFYELAPTLIKDDEFGEAIINKEYDIEMLAKAVALHEGFDYNPNAEVFWKQSTGNENSYLYVTTQFLDVGVLDRIHNSMTDKEYLIIACTSYDESLVNKYKNIVIKKIPEMLLKKCAFNVDNYNLNVIESESEKECDEE